MSDESYEVRRVIANLECRAADLGLTPTEVGKILLLKPGGWPLPISEQWAPIERSREARIRDLREVLQSVQAVVGFHAMFWLRRPNGHSGISPLEFLMSDSDALRALRDVLRLETGSG